jgi:hypothetical protein
MKIGVVEEIINTAHATARLHYRVYYQKEVAEINGKMRGKIFCVNGRAVGAARWRLRVRAQYIKLWLFKHRLHEVSHCPIG